MDRALRTILSRWEQEMRISCQCVRDLTKGMKMRLVLCELNKIHDVRVDIKYCPIKALSGMREQLIEIVH